MTLAYFDCFAGAGGDMIVGALLDAGCDFEALKAHLARLGAEGYSLEMEKVRRCGIAATRFVVETGHEHAHRGLADILDMIDRAALPPRAAQRAHAVFTRLAEAEAKVHHVDIQSVHFHEVGAVDSIMDIVGACLALEILGIDRVACSPLPTGSGTIRTQHGLLPVPAPATAQLLVGATTFQDGLQGEVLTPTAAALLTTLTESYGPPPALSLAAVGHGAGTRDTDAIPNILRVLIGQPSDEGQADGALELSCNLDDCTGQVIGATIEGLLAAGAMDAWAAPIVMKKSRPAWTLCALCSPADAGKIEDILFAQTPTFGVRRHACSRSKLLRRHETVQTPFGPIRIKVGRRGDRDLTATPEFSDCRTAAEAHHASVREVMQAAVEIYRAEKRS